MDVYSAAPSTRELDDPRTGNDKESLKKAFLDHLLYVQGKFPKLATEHDYYVALAYVVRDRLLQRWISTAEAYTRKGSRTVAYFSAEFLLGPHLGNNLVNLGITGVVAEAMTELGFKLDDLLALEAEPGLGNGGLGRLAACFLDSLATLEIPSLGYGIRYEFGIFDQHIVDGWQVEKTDKWLRFGNPWELARPEWAKLVKLGGCVERYTDIDGAYRARWVPERTVIGVPYDTPILGYATNTANTLRLWRAEAPESFDFAVFNRGDFYGAVHDKVTSENITKVLYPNDESFQGKELRLAQQYFFVSCSLQDMIRIMQGQNLPLDRFHEKFAAQLNDTHPAIAIPELMRLFIDEHEMEWDRAWSITRQTFAYTNHTLLPEALECWPVELLGSLLPRHLEIIYEINARFLDEARIRFFGDDRRVAALSLIDEYNGRRVRMAHLACVGSHAVNGVAELHTSLLTRHVMSDFHALWPQMFSNKTNGVTPRRWMVLSNLRLTGLISEAIGEGWIRKLEDLKRLEPLADDAAFRARWQAVKRANKAAFAEFIRHRTGIATDPDSLFDIQVKRIHEYKRQHLNILHVIGLYHRLRSNPSLDITPRTFVFGGKAAPGYRMAKLIIKLITAVGDIVNRDPAVHDRIKVVFLPNFNVSSGQHVYPAAELSEQISTAGTEASGTGNMKFAMNGALTLGTLDGANIEICEEVGKENFFWFGLTADQVHDLRMHGYRPQDYLAASDELGEIFELLMSGFFTRGDTTTFEPLIRNLCDHDPFCVLADYESYASAQRTVDAAYRDKERWSRMSILSSARSGKFSSDRTIGEYCRDIWRVEPVPIQLLTRDQVRATFLQ